MSMSYALFELPGKIRDNEVVFLTSKQRKYKEGETVYHRNNIHNRVRVPMPIFKEHFKYERSSGIYRTKLRWGTLRHIPNVEIETTKDKY